MTYKGRISGVIPKLTSNSIPSNILVIDTETYIQTDYDGNQVMPFRLGCAIYTRLNKQYERVVSYDYTYFSIDEFIDILKSLMRKKTTLYIVGHNIGFDIMVLKLIHIFKDMDWLSKPPIINNRIFIWDVVTDNGSLSFIDSANFGVISVEQLGYDMGYSKMKVDFETVSEQELITYCLRDCEIVEKFLIDYIKFIGENELGSFRSTIASQAFCAYRSRFMSHDIHIHNYEYELALERKAYSGGRTESFALGVFNKDNYYYLDINSMYPYVMLHKKIPYRHHRTYHDTNSAFLESYIDKYYMIAEVELETENNFYPLKHSGKLLFPIGNFITTLHHAELEIALKYNHIKRVISVAFYHHDYLFSSYVEFFYKEKERYTREGNKSYRYITKLFLNSLYGKFGQLNIYRTKTDRTSKKVFDRRACINLDNGEHYQEITWLYNIYKEIRQGETQYSYPAIAGSITSYARRLLLDYMIIAGMDTIYYCDTDSMIVSEDTYHKLSMVIDEYQIGMLKIEDVSTYLDIRGNKDYQFGNTEHVKGVNLSKSKFDGQTWFFLEFDTFKSYLKRDGQGEATARPKTKRRRSSYSKGIVMDDGWIKPYRFYLLDGLNHLQTE